MEFFVIGALAFVFFFRRGEKAEDETTGKCKMPSSKSWTFATWPPPGLPKSARRPSAAGAAYPAIRAAALAQNLGPEFAEVMLSMARHESGGRFGMPAWKYDNRPEKERPKGQCRISAWGVFQWQDSWAIKAWGSPLKSYMMTEHDEGARAVEYYARFVRASPGQDPFVAWILHSSPYWGERMAKKGAATLPPKYQKKLAYYKGRVSKYRSQGFV